MNNTPKLLSNKEQKLLNDKLFQLIVIGDVQAIIKCIQQGANIYAQNRYGDTALKMAIQYLNKDDVQVIFNFVKQNKTPKTEKHTTNTQQASNTKPIEKQPVITNNDTSKSLSKQEQNKLNQQLFHAILSENIQAIENCIQKGADVNARNEIKSTPLMVACKSNKTDITNLLIDKGADVNARNHQGDTPLMAACRYGNIDTVNRLIEKGADVNVCDDFGDTPLKEACIYDNMDTVNLLIDKGADVNARNNKGYTPLMVIFSIDNIDTVNRLIEKGADVNARNNEGCTPLMEAFKYSEIDAVVNLFIEKGADVNARNNEGDTPLMEACRYGKIDAINLLIENGADVNARNNEGRTPLIEACRYGEIDTVNLLIEKEADVHIRDSKGNTAYNYLFDYIKTYTISPQDMPTLKKMLNHLKEPHSVKNNIKRWLKTLKDEFSH